MKNQKLNKGIKELKEIRMSKVEELDMLTNLMKYVDETSPVQQTNPIKSNFYNLNLNSFYISSRFVYATFSFIGIFFVGASGIFAASSSIPGDILYPIKTKIVEPVQELLAVTPTAKANLSAIKTENTLKEAELLIKNNSLNEQNRLLLEEDLKRHTDNFNNITKNPEINNSVEISETKTRLKNTVEEYSKILNTMKENDHSEQKDQIEKFNNIIINTFGDSKRTNSTTTEENKKEETKEISNKINKRINDSSRKISPKITQQQNTNSYSKLTDNSSNYNHRENDDDDDYTKPLNISSGTSTQNISTDSSSKNEYDDDEHDYVQYHNINYQSSATNTQSVNNNASTTTSTTTTITTSNQQSGTSTPVTNTSTSTQSTSTQIISSGHYNRDDDNDSRDDNDNDDDNSGSRDDEDDDNDDDDHDD